MDYYKKYLKYKSKYLSLRNNNSIPNPISNISIIKTIPTIPIPITNTPISN